MRTRWAVASGLWVFLLPGFAFAQESGYQIINGTRVFTQIDHAADTATFSNDCGSQTLTHQQLGAGAIPSDIIPCPRVSKTCPAGQRRSDAGACLPEDAQDCGHGHYCSSGSVCYDAICLDKKALTQCPDGHYCENPGDVCTRSNECLLSGDNRICHPDTHYTCKLGTICVALHQDDGSTKFGCSSTSHRYRRGEERLNFIVPSGKGNFFGISEGRIEDQERLIAEAAASCEAQKRNLESNVDQKAEPCEASRSSYGKCVALAKSQEYFYGKPEEMAYGVGVGDTEEEAKIEAFRHCKFDGGHSCQLIADSVACTNREN